MDIKRFGNRQGKTMMLLHGNLMCWRQFEDLIPLLERKFCVYAVSFDGFDGTGETTYTTARDQADKLAAYIEKELDGQLDLLFAESLGCCLLYTSFDAGNVLLPLCRRGGSNNEIFFKISENG